LFATVAPEKLASQELDASVGASGPHDFAVRDRAIRQRRIRVHRIPRPTFVTIAKRPSLGAGPNQNIPASTRPSSEIRKIRNRRDGWAHGFLEYDNDPVFVMAGLVPAIHAFLAQLQQRRGCPAQGRA
jgi:hypothetical protein